MARKTKKSKSTSKRKRSVKKIKVASSCPTGRKRVSGYSVGSYCRKIKNK